MALGSEVTCIHRLRSTWHPAGAQEREPLRVFHAQFEGSRPADVLHPSGLALGGDHHLLRFKPVCVRCHKKPAPQDRTRSDASEAARLALLLPGRGSGFAEVHRGWTSLAVYHPGDAQGSFEALSICSSRPQSSLAAYSDAAGWVRGTGSPWDPLAFWLSI